MKYFLKNTPKSAKNGVFCRFGDSAASTEASPEPIRSKTAEASAEASVSVVHYLRLFIINSTYLAEHFS